MKGIIKTITIAGIIFFGISVSIIYSATPIPVHIKSDIMEVKRKEHKIVFSGKVMAQQGDMQIYADKLTANYGKSGEEINSIEATGSVKIIEKDKVATSGEIFFDNIKRLIMFKNNPRIWTGDDILEGEEIIYYIDQDSFTVKKATASIRSREWKNESKKD
ncbi:MAG TPA: lipopolysaccharide transport periplasmic protein LptA [bacterium]